MWEDSVGVGESALWIFSVFHSVFHCSTLGCPWPHTFSCHTGEFHLFDKVWPPPLPLKNLSYVLAFLPHVVYSCLCKGSEKGPSQVKESFRQFSCLFIKVSYFVPTSDRHGIMATQDKYQPRMESESWRSFRPQSHARLIESFFLSLCESFLPCGFNIA